MSTNPNASFSTSHFEICEEIVAEMLWYVGPGPATNIVESLIIPVRNAHISTARMTSTVSLSYRIEHHGIFMTLFALT